MIPITTESRYNAMVKLREGKISREIFSDKDIYQDELEKVFTRAWLFVGHESQVPNPGDFFTSRMGAESVILARDKKKKVHVFLNSCRHRGMKVCQYDHGNTQLFTCPYHSWSYTTDGKLFGVPQFKQLYEGCMEKGRMVADRAAEDGGLQGYRLGQLGQGRARPDDLSG
jgi:phenylpropionate dioxygenase-like ring-hydroxylating dioxygenase large terminal subunit